MVPTFSLILSILVFSTLTSLMCSNPNTKLNSTFSFEVFDNTYATATHPLNEIKTNNRMACLKRCAPGTLFL